MGSSSKSVHKQAIKNAKYILSVVKEALAAGTSVLLTDGTVTRKVVHVEISNWDPTQNTFDVQTVDSDENKSWTQIELAWPWDELIECGLVELDGSLYIAPDWWIET